MIEPKDNSPQNIKISKIIDKKVFTKEEGKYLGKVSKVTFNHRSKKVASLIIKESKWNRQLYQVLTKEIVNIGEDIIYITSLENCFHLKGTELIDEMSFQNIDKHRIITDDGKFIGIVDDMAVSLDTFLIKELIFKDDSHLNIDPSKIVLGHDEIIVPKALEQKIIRENKKNIFKKYVHFKGREDFSDAQARLKKERQDKAIRENIH